MKKTKDNYFSDLLLESISRDKENPSQTKYLTMLTGLSVRELKAVIFELRKNYPICSKVIDGGGYWIAEDEEDIRDFINLMNSRIWSTQKTIDRMQNHFEDLADSNGI